ncbi:GEVED domain-containing protein [Hymenobacter terrenus]|uniref:GEVED domain-containing protein n=1 Tax=Hymenobacter terrenus TaxID=1629124 RepID=UPI000A721526|nr:GEVED domain-containing protein [Hymenobacter terrenus]
MELLEAQMRADPALAQRLAKINNQAVEYAKQPDKSAQRSTAVTVTIPVVVHVLYNTTAQNVSDAQIASQIAVLNEDFQKLNADAANVPPAFASLVANVNIAFVLAKRTPTGAATTGIVRKSTTRTSWPVDNPQTGEFYEYMKRNSDGGSDPWDTSKYLNIWVCNMAGSTLGYAQFPGGPAALDGVVILTSAFGKGGSATAPFNLGRTATHEVGHWLNLRHIWGDDDGACTGSDLVSDTPNQADENIGVPNYPNPSCSNTSDMFMNYMDYTDDRGMYMFSTGQSTRMNALFATGGARASLLASQGGVAPTGGGTTTPPPTTVTYCASRGSSQEFEYLDLVRLGSINRTSGADGGYYNGTALSTSVAQGSSQTISFSAGFSGQAYTEYVKVYADWNQNGVFTDANELVVSAPGSTSAATRTGTFTVPTAAKIGKTRLRVVLSDGSGTASCGSYNYGETEDYSITVTGSASATAREDNSNRAADQYTVYPNPATEVLKIARPLNADSEEPFTVHVRDLTGREVRGLHLEGNGQLNISSLKTGTYLLDVSDRHTTTHQRFEKR